MLKTFKKHAEHFVAAVAKSKLPFVEYEVARVADRKDPFARRIFLTSLCDNRTRMQLQEFRLSRAYFFGTFIREGRNSDGSLRMYPCLLKNCCGKICNNFCDPFGHHVFVCKNTTKTADHNMCRDTLSTMGNAFGFVTSKEVVVAPWFKKPDVEFLDASGELLTIYLDVTLPALHQEAITSREDVYENARQLKAKAYPRKDSAGRLQNENFCLPFILTSMGGLCEEGHDFLRLCKKRNKAATLHMLDVLVTQHAKWTAKRVRRGLFGQSLVDFSTESWSSIQLKESAKDFAAQQTRTQPKKTPRLLRSFAQSRVVADKQSMQQPLVPGMSQYSDDVDMDAGTADHPGNKKLSQEADVESVGPGFSDAFSVFG